jgi:hypothetical protein
MLGGVGSGDCVACEMIVFISCVASILLTKQTLSVVYVAACDINAPKRVIVNSAACRVRPSCVWHFMCRMGLSILRRRAVELCVQSLGKLIPFCRMKWNCLVLSCVESNLCARQCQVNYCGSWCVCVSRLCIAVNLLVCTNWWSISAMCECAACASWTNVSMRFVCLSYARART